MPQPLHAACVLNLNASNLSYGLSHNGIVHSLPYNLVHAYFMIII